MNHDILGFRLSVNNCSTWTTRESTRELISNLDDALRPLHPHLFYLVKESTPHTYHVQIVRSRTELIEIGSIQWSSTDSTLRLYNVGRAITMANLRDIHISNGNFEEGLMSALGPLLKRECEVIFETGEFCHKFIAQTNPDDPEHKFVSMEDASLCRKIHDQTQTYTLITVTNLPTINDISKDWFLFLLNISSSKVIPVFQGHQTPALLLDYPSSIFVNNVFVTKKVHCPFGMSIIKDVDRKTVKKSASLILTTIIVQSQRKQYNPEFIKYLFQLFNSDGSVLFLSDLQEWLICQNRILIRSFLKALFQYGLSPTQTAYCPRWYGDLDRNQHMMLSVMSKSDLCPVSNYLFKFMWLHQEEILKTRYDLFLTTLMNNPISINSLNNPNKCKYERLVKFLNELLCISHDVEVRLVNSPIVGIYNQQFPCVWQNDNNRLIVDVKLFKRVFIHSRLNFESKQVPNNVNQIWECKVSNCYCLELLVMLQVADSIRMSKSYITQYMLHWAHRNPISMDEMEDEEEPGRSHSIPDFDIDSVQRNVEIPMLPPISQHTFDWEQLINPLKQSNWSEVDDEGLSKQIKTLNDASREIQDILQTIQCECQIRLNKLAEDENSIHELEQEAQRRRQTIGNKRRLLNCEGVKYE